MQLKAAELGVSYEWAVKYYVGCKNGSIPLEKLISLFQTYEDCCKTGMKKSYLELGEISGMHPVTIGKILRKLSLPSLYWNYTLLTDDERKVIASAIKRLKQNSIAISSKDLEYYLKLSPIYESLSIKNVRSWFDVGWQKLSYRTASQIYEAVDAGFNMNETLQYADTTIEKYEFALRNRNRGERIEKKIIQFLRVIFSKEKIKKPYR